MTEKYCGLSADCFLSISIIRLRRICVLLDAKLIDAAAAQLIHVLPPVVNTVHPTSQPGLAVSLRFCLLMILAEECVVALVASLHRRWMRSVPALDHRRNQKAGNHRAIGVAGNH